MTDEGRWPALDVSLVAPDPWEPVELIEQTPSTNAVLLADPRPWRVVVAERQTSGRGRLDRRWVSEPGLGLTLSCVLPADGIPLGWIPLLAGVAVCRALESTAGVDAVLKWPNDVLLPADQERKVAGILCEWTPVGVVVGVGVNIHSPREALPVEHATSVALVGGDTTRTAMLAAFLREFAAGAASFRRDAVSGRTGYVSRCVTVGREVVVEEPHARRSGLATGVDSEGRLEIHTSDGEVVIAAGDVIHVRPEGCVPGR